MTAVKLNISHQENISKECMIINPKDFPGAQIGDIFEICQPLGSPKLVLQVTELSEDSQMKVIISPSLATAFQLKTFNEVFVNKIDPATVTLDQVELVFKDQYLSRSDMWRLQEKCLVDTCVYLNKKIEFQNSGTRPQILNMWRDGQNVTCGYISSNTKIVYRSLTGLVNIFIQMSSEMWELNNIGDLHFEIAIDGFLSDLCEKWKSMGSNHDVTVVFFTRVFYHVSSYNDFPPHMRICIQQDLKGRFYEDFYRVIVQNMRNELFGESLRNLKKEFNTYKEAIFKLHEKPDILVPKGTISTASQGNFLEVLNLNLNGFEKHYIDRNFDRTGLIAIVISPGVGVFEVDQELANISKQRAIDTGIATDLVCLGHQPLHAVPLFQYPLKISQCNYTSATDYGMPHWLNLSFYSNTIMSGYKAFIPRINPPEVKINISRSNVGGISETVQTFSEIDPIEDEAYCDEFDSQVFTWRGKRSTALPLKIGLKKRSGAPSPILNPSASTHSSTKIKSISQRRKISECDSIPGEAALSCSLPVSEAINIPQTDKGTISQCSKSWREHEGHFSAVTDADSDDGSYVVKLSHSKSNVSAQQKTLPSNRTLVNPFDPSNLTIPLTSSRRRWSHIFPKGPEGVLIQQHHQPDPTIEEGGLQMEQQELPSNKNFLLLWGPTGEQKWAPNLTTKVDWKALIIPACLPITTDYFPDPKSLQNDYVLSDYNLLPEDVNSDSSPRIKLFGETKRMSTEGVFEELICQRLQQGFQLIITTLPQSYSQSNVVNGLISSSSTAQEIRECFLSLGRIFHKLTLSGSTITVTRYRPRHSYHGLRMVYKYRYLDNYNSSYRQGYATFSPEFIESYNWNYLDHYICTRGDRDFQLIPSLKYWRSRFLIIPNFMAANVKKILESESSHFEEKLSLEISKEVMAQIQTSLFAFFEVTLNKIKAISTCRKKKNMKGCRDRLNTSALLEKPKQKLIVSSEDSSKSGSNKTSTESSPENKDNDSDSNSEKKKLCKSSSLVEIVDMMKDDKNGLPLFNQFRGLPNGTFISAEAVTWLMINIEGMTEEEAIKLLQDMKSCHLICHASGDDKFPFLFGFYFYYLINAEPDKTETDKNYDPNLYKPIKDLVEFQRMWMETGVVLCHPEKFCFGNLILSPNLLSDLKSTPLYKEIVKLKPVFDLRVTDIDFPSKFDRYEWCHVDYHSTYRIDAAFEMTIKWMAASGNVLGDMLMTWSRKMTPFCIVPAPANPFPVMSTTNNKDLIDPFRCPIFIPLNLKCLMSGAGVLFSDFEEDTRGMRLYLLQECILKNFGFMPCKFNQTVPLTDESYSDPHYIHCSGYMLALITPQLVWDSGDSPEGEVGFYWTWNYAFSKKLKIISSPIKDRVLLNFLRDFKAFCEDEDNRFRNFVSKVTGHKF